MKIAISGAGVAGPALAHWLHRSGHEPTLIERAPHCTGGYVIDFWGSGLPRRATDGDRGGHPRGRLPGAVDPLGRARHRASQRGRRRFPARNWRRFHQPARGDLAATIYATIEDDVETIFGDSITAINEHPDGVNVSFAQASPGF